MKALESGKPYKECTVVFDDWMSLSNKRMSFCVPIVMGITWKMLLQLEHIIQDTIRNINDASSRCNNKVPLFPICKVHASMFQWIVYYRRLLNILWLSHYLLLSQHYRYPLWGVHCYRVQERMYSREGMYAFSVTLKWCSHLSFQVFHSHSIWRLLGSLRRFQPAQHLSELWRKEPGAWMIFRVLLMLVIPWLSGPVKYSLVLLKKEPGFWKTLQ